MSKKIIASLVTLAFVSPLLAAENINLEDITVKANRFERKDTETTYASEIHTAKKIEASGAATLFDYLAQQTSLNLLSNFGNKATPSINLRGYGNENGHQNVVITLDGQRLNNIDLQTPLLGAIPLGNIERIEISKGSGSVIYGDGATAGTIQIYTKNKTGVTVSTSLGSFGQQNHYINAGISEQFIDLSANLAHDSHDGFSKKDITGHKDEFTSDTQNVKLRIKPTDSLRFDIGGTSSRNDIRYVNPLSQAMFKADPRQSGSSAYTHQSFDTDQWRVGAEYDISPKFKIVAMHYQEDKFSEFISSNPSTADSIYKSNDLSLHYESDLLSAIVGYQDFDGERTSNSNFFGSVSKDKTSKDNKAFFMQSEYAIDALTLSAGYRNERVKYNFSPIIAPFGAVAAKNSGHINAWDVGANYRFNDEISIFANFNQAYQTPDIDRLFNFSGGFNGFIEPAKAKTFNAGFNHTTLNNRLKISAFHTDLDNEIYLVPDIFKSTNLDQTHKYGLEVQDYFKFNDQLTASVIYNYTRAIIDEEDDGAGAFNGKDLPGAPKHTIVLNLNYNFFDHASFNLNHTWRAKAYAYNDFQNNFKQKQDNYESTNIALNYQYRNFLFFTSINNLFEHENSIQTSDDITGSGTYPTDFVRTWRVGMKADF